MASNFNPVDIKPDVKKTVNGFGSFKVALADVLTVTTVLQLATFFEYPPVTIEELSNAASAGLLMIRYMEERGQIQPTSILKLLSALKKMCLSGTGDCVKKLYEKHTGRQCSSDGQSKAQNEGKLKIFTNSLKHTYALWYNRIQPIPYIREKICCVDDIYVESGLELVHQLPSFKHDSQSFEESGLVSLKSFRDIFDSDIIPSNRILLEGDPGYGKSTLTLQAAYDWCLGNVARPLKNVAVFILLPLRLLGNISSIFEAIRFVLMPPESPLTNNDILEILRDSLSVVIVLDGYDEYPDKNSVIETDIMKMIAGKMFPNVKVVVSTRSSSLPTYLDPSTVTIRLTGFDEKSRDEYIKRTVTGGDQEASSRITNALNSSPILNDICQVPMFCVLFAHVANDQRGVIEFSSVTSFFKYVIDCFYSHMWRKDHKEPIHQSIREYSKLNRLAFDGLTGNAQMIAWPKHTFIDTVGKDCYEELSYIGILIVEKTNEIINEPEEFDIHHIKQNELVRFYHKLFAEWYAAKYLSSYAGSFWPFWLKYKLNKINPVDLQFVFRFACGLNKKASGRIIKYLKSVEGGASFASLCLFEQPDNPEKVVESVKGLCSDGMIIRSSDSRLLQRSNIQLLDIASRKKIQVPCLQLDHSFKVAHQKEVTLESGLSLPVLSSIEKLVFSTQAEYEISQENMLGVVEYGQRCLQLKTLVFHGKFVLPLSLTVETLESNMNSRSITVFWQLLEYVFQLDVSSGKWRLSSTESLTSGIVEPGEDVEMLRSVCSGGMAFRCTDSRILQRANIQFLEIASRHKIPLSCLVLDTFLEADQHSITLENGNHVPVLSTLEEMQIRTEKRIEFTEEQVVGLLCYAKQCQKLKNIQCIDCLVPLCFPNNSLWPFKSDKLKVLWKPGEQEFDLNFTKSRWTLVSKEYLTLETKDQQSLTKMCSGTVTLHTNDTNEYLGSVILLLQIAASQHIPLSCLVLDSFHEADQHSITLENGNHVPVLSTLEEMQIRTEKRIEFTQEQVVGLLCYAQQCPNLQKISFINCLVPLCFSNDPLWPCESNTLKVLWKPGEHKFDLNFTRGRWTLVSQEYLTLETKDQQSLTKMCSRTVTLQTNDTKEYYRSIILLLQIAASQQIPLSCLVLDSFHEADQHSITLENGYHVPVLSTLEEMQIRTEKGTEFTQEQVVVLLCYAQQCPKLQKISFMDCLVPLCFPSNFFWLCESDTLKVLWKPGEHKFVLNLTKGRWTLVSHEYLTLETKDHHSLTKMCSGTVTLNINDTKEYHRSVILLLQIAASQQIQITSLLLKSFSSADQNHLILESRYRVPPLSTLKELQIKTKLGKEFTQDQVLGLFCFVQQCQKLQKVSFIDCLLPLSLPVGSLSRFTKLQDIEVSWKPSKPDIHLDSSKGKWVLNSNEGITLETEDQNSLRRLCSSIMLLKATDSKQLQMSTILLLEIASTHNIPISHLYLKWSFSGFDGKDIRLGSGLSLSSLSSVEKISINGGGIKELSEEEVIGLINYGIYSQRFKALWLRNYKLPPSIKPDIIPEESRSRNIKVISPGEAHVLDLESGKWKKPDDIHTIAGICSDELIIDSYTSESVQRSVIEFLVEASNHDIPIYRVSLNWSFSKIDGDGNIILSSGLSLPIIKSIVLMKIQTEKGREINKQEFYGILNYLQHSQRFKALSLSDCSQPSSRPIGPVLSTLKSRGVIVFWEPDSDKSDETYHLDLNSGRWLY